MKKINIYSAQFKIIQKPMKNTNENQFDEKIIQKNNKKKEIIKTKPRIHK